MAVLGTIKTTWVVDEIVTEDDINRWEGNIEYAIYPNGGMVNSTGLSTTMSSAAFAVVGSTVNVKTYTGRCLVIGTVIYEQTSAASCDYDFTITYGGNNVVPSSHLSRFTSAATIGWNTQNFSFLVTGLTPGTTYTWDIRYQKQAGTNATGRIVRLIVIDI